MVRFTALAMAAAAATLPKNVMAATFLEKGKPDNLLKKTPSLTTDSVAKAVEDASSMVQGTNITSIVPPPSTVPMGPTDPFILDLMDLNLVTLGGPEDGFLQDRDYLGIISLSNDPWDSEKDRGVTGHMARGIWAAVGAIDEESTRSELKGLYEAGQQPLPSSNRAWANIFFRYFCDPQDPGAFPDRLPLEARTASARDRFRGGWGYFVAHDLSVENCDPQLFSDRFSEYLSHYKPSLTSWYWKYDRNDYLGNAWFTKNMIRGICGPLSKYEPGNEFSTLVLPEPYLQVPGLVKICHDDGFIMPTFGETNPIRWSSFLIIGGIIGVFCCCVGICVCICDMCSKKEDEDVYINEPRIRRRRN